MALHGGLEPGTEEIATRVAARTEASLYALHMPDDLAWHVPSVHYDPKASVALAAFLGHVRFAVSIHGHHRPEFPATVLLGGRNRVLAERIGAALRRATDLAVCDDLDQIPRDLRGVDSRNPVNVPSVGGVQVELPPVARERRPGKEVVAGVSVAILAETHASP